MKNFCCYSSGGDNSDDDDIKVDPQLAKSLADLSASISDELRPHQAIELIKRHGTYSTTLARFSEDGPLYKVVISLKEKGQNVMKLKVTVDNAVVYKVETPDQYQENVKLSVDGMTVDFMWDLREALQIFSFKAWPNDEDGEDEENFYWFLIKGFPIDRF